MRRLLNAVFLLFAGIASLIAVPASASTVPETYDNALTCAVLYAYYGDRGAGFDRLIAIASEKSGKSTAVVMTELEPQLEKFRPIIASGKFSEKDVSALTQDACPTTFGIAAAKSAPTPINFSAPNGLAARQCAGLYEFFDREYPMDSTGRTWASKEMTTKSATLQNISGSEAFDRSFATYGDYYASWKKASDASRDKEWMAFHLDQAVKCQNAFGTVAPPGAVFAAAQFGDPAGFEPARTSFCQAMSNNFYERFPDMDAYARDSLTYDPIELDDALDNQISDLLNHLEIMENANCSGSYTSPLLNALEGARVKQLEAIKAQTEKINRTGIWW